MVSLPLAAFEFVRSPQPAQIARGFATAAVLMILVLCSSPSPASSAADPPGGCRSASRAKPSPLARAQRLERVELDAAFGAPTDASGTST